MRVKWQRLCISFSPMLRNLEMIRINTIASLEVGSA